MRLLLSNFETLKWLYFLILGFVGNFAGHLHAQKLYFSNIPRLNSKAYYSKVIGENAGGVYVLRYRDADLKNGFTVERYSHNLDYIESDAYLVGKRERLLKIFTMDSGLLLIKITYNKENVTTITGGRTGYKVSSALQTFTLYETKNAERIDENAIVEYSPNRKYGAIWLKELNKHEDQIFTCIVFKTTGEIVFTRQYETDFYSRDIELQQAAVSDSGQSALVFMLTRDEKRNTEPSAEEHFLLTAISEKKGNIMPLGDNKFFLASYDLVYNEYTKRFCLSGYFDFKQPKTVHGIFDLQFKAQDSTIHPQFIPLERKFVGQLIGAKEEEAGNDPVNFYVRKIVPRSDGGYILIGEYFEITQQMETFYLNGVPQVSSKNVYNYNDIILLSVSNKSELEWSHIIHKRQSSYASLSYLHSFGTYVCEKNINIVYNDNSSQNNRVMHITLTRDGVIEQKIILNSENEYTAIIPQEGRQTGYNRYVAPLIQSRQISLIQMVDVN